VDSKTVLITGGNNGIGKATAKALCENGANVVIACRNKDKANIAQQEINAICGNPPKIMYLDLADMLSIYQFAQDFTQAESRLDVLINNAGMIAYRKGLTRDGFESQFGVNHLGHFLLTYLLMDLLKESAPARVITVSSMAHMTAKIDFNSLYAEKFYHPFRAYAQSKLANILFTRELAKTLKDTGVSAFCLHPGGVNTGLFGKTPWLLGPLARRVLRSPEAGATTTLYLATKQGIEDYSGEYFRNRKVAWTSPAARNPTTARKLWETSMEMCGLT